MNQAEYDKIPWIDINLPWRSEVDWEKEPAPPSLDDKEREVFGISLTDLQEKNQPYIDQCVALSQTLDIILDEARAKAYQNGESDVYYQNVTKLKNDFWEIHAQDTCVIARDAYIELRDKICEWSDEQPEWKAWQKVRAEFIAEEEKKSFTGRKLNVPGTIVEMEDGSIEFIGSMNAIAGVCNDCVAFERDNLIVKRYALVYPFTKRKANDDFYADE